MSEITFKTEEEKNKQSTILKQSKGQLEASITKVEPFLSSEDFNDYCDMIYSCIAYQTKILTSISRTVITPKTI